MYLNIKDWAPIKLPFLEQRPLFYIQTHTSTNYLIQKLFFFFHSSISQTTESHSQKADTQA